VMTHIRQAARMTALVDCASELKKSIRDQRAILRDLRRSVDHVRHWIRWSKR
jgi:hypothetical protein